MFFINADVAVMKVLFNNLDSYPTTSLRMLIMFNVK